MTRELRTRDFTRLLAHRTANQGVPLVGTGSRHVETRFHKTLRSRRLMFDLRLFVCPMLRLCWILPFLVCTTCSARRTCAFHGVLCRFRPRVYVFPSMFRLVPWPLPRLLDRMFLAERRLSECSRSVSSADDTDVTMGRCACGWSGGEREHCRYSEMVRTPRTVDSASCCPLGAAGLPLSTTCSPLSRLQTPAWGADTRRQEYSNAGVDSARANRSGSQVGPGCVLSVGSRSFVNLLF